MDEKKQYISLVTNIIAKQSIILGPDIAILKARSVNGLVLDNQGKVLDIQIDPATVIKDLINTYIELSGKIVNQPIISIFKRYPNLKIPEGL